MKINIILGAALLAASVAHATLYTVNSGLTGLNPTGTSLNLAVPDGNPVGIANSQTLSGVPPQIDSQDATIQSVSVMLNISGGYNGDLYGYLVLQPTVGGTPLMVELLNRVGSSTTPFGSSASGFSNVLLTDGAANSIQDATDFSGATAYSASAGSTALNSTFGGKTANGTWTLYLADLASGDTSTLVGWSAQISVVPEPITWALVGFALVLGLTRFVAWRTERRQA